MPRTYEIPMRSEIKKIHQVIGEAHMVITNSFLSSLNPILPDL
jgi:hypothetical protein